MDSEMEMDRNCNAKRSLNRALTHLQARSSFDLDNHALDAFWDIFTNRMRRRGDCSGDRCGIWVTFGAHDLGAPINGSRKPYVTYRVSD